MKKKYLMLLFLVLLLSCNPAFGDVNLSRYEYRREITVNCGEFLGYAKFEASNDFLLKSQNLRNFYIDAEYYAEKVAESKSYSWYISDSSINDLESLKKIVDGDGSSYYYMQKPDNRITLDLKNPNNQKFNKIVITLSDSELKNAEFIDNSNNKILNPKAIKDGFVYTYLFDDDVTANDIKININFENILKISEIEFFEKKDKTNIYLYINNKCEKTYFMYYGEFGGSFETYKRYDSGKILDAQLKDETINSLYKNDFDNDKILNNIDNCPYIPNREQKDINFNGVGDECEDFDGDGVINSKDNCPQKYNSDQSDVDKDGIGDACDDKDDRFSEKNKYLIYGVAFIVLLLFVYLGYVLLKKK